ncbi:MAG: hypothetical protein CFE34_09505 [Rhodobacteraceae bacterium PARR1]|nr:MAG: hypothetical protein CFE34_09505 [Rhodobacteraceae bacterium PARR1]
MNASSSVPDNIFVVRTFDVAHYRIRAVLFAAAGFYLIWLITAEGRLLLSLHKMPWSYLITFPSVFFPFVLAWLSWRRVPWGSTGGQLRIGADGVEFKRGPDHLHRDWASIGAIHQMRVGNNIPAVWLATNGDPVPDQTFKREMGRALAKGGFRPVVRPDGLLLPLDGFESSFAPILDNITKALHRCLEAHRTSQ